MVLEPLRSGYLNQSWDAEQFKGVIRCYRVNANRFYEALNYESYVYGKCSLLGLKQSHDGAGMAQSSLMMVPAWHTTLDAVS